MSEDHPASIARRHDLDALRAVAMLLGIVLHGALSFIPFAWVIQDSQPNLAFGLVLASIHGFRMPLFFLISGFFTAMLWRKRGMKSLLAHRFKRIFLPLVIGVLTVVPATWIVTIYVSSPDRAAKSVEATANSSAAFSAESTDSAAIIRAVAKDDADLLTSLIERGADVNAKDERGSTPLHVAVFFGRAEAARILLDAGADLDALNNEGKRPVELLYVPWGITKFVAGLARVEVDKDELLQGRREIAALLDVPLAGQSADAVGAKAGSSEETVLGGLIGLLMYFPLFGHLWFLWFLCWLVIAFAICAKIGSLLGVRGVPNWMSVSIWRYAWLIPLTAVPQFFMGQAGNDFGPDTSLGLLPLPSVLSYYAIFFVFGALYFDADDHDGRVGRRWWIVLPIALLIVFPIGLATGSQDAGIGRGLSVFSQVAYAWLVSFGMMGLFRRFLSNENKTMRYLSDSSYWLYLAHIPPIIYIQYLVRDWSLSPLVKFALICLVTSGLLLLSYQLFVRYTPIGTLLNGPRRRLPHPEEILDTEIMEAEVASGTSTLRA